MHLGTSLLTVGQGPGRFPHANYSTHVLITLWFPEHRCWSHVCCRTDRPVKYKRLCPQHRKGKDKTRNLKLSVVLLKTSVCPCFLPEQAHSTEFREDGATAAPHRDQGTFSLGRETRRWNSKAISEGHMRQNTCATPALPGEHLLCNGEQRKCFCWNAQTIHLLDDAFQRDSLVMPGVLNLVPKNVSASGRQASSPQISCRPEN